MSDESFKTITELIIRYDLEPDLRDVYVEGRRDFIFFKKFFEITNHYNVVVYQISDCVRFSEEQRKKAEIENLNLLQNNRNKLIFLQKK